MTHERTAQLLAYAMTMLQTARREQVNRRVKDKWLCDNETLEAIELHVSDLRESGMEI